MECDVAAVGSSRSSSNMMMQQGPHGHDDETVTGTGQDQPSGRPGFVNQVCREWLVREDEGVAHRLQDEEFQHHYGHNRSKNMLVRQDTQQARTLQTEEELTAAEVQQQLELMCLKQEEDDAKMAQEVQELLSQQDVEKRRHLQEADEQYARHLQDKEKERLQRKKREKEQKQVERALAHHAQPGAASCDLNYLSNDEQGVVSGIDFSDLCVQPTPDMSVTQTKVLQEQQDEELAKLLQEQESKRGAPSDLDQKLAVETQDREIAKYLQEQERGKAKKARERARSRALQQQREQELQSQEIAMSLPNEDSDSSLTLESSSSRCKSTSSRSEKQYSQSALTDGPHMSNIAMAIDPTYNRKLSDIPKPVTMTTSASLHSAPATPVKSVMTKASSPDRPSYQTEVRKISSDNEYRSSSYDDDPAPPYMPIQGQRRTGSLEKPSGKKNKKDSCKNQ